MAEIKIKNPLSLDEILILGKKCFIFAVYVNKKQFIVKGYFFNTQEVFHERRQELDSNQLR